MRTKKLGFREKCKMAARKAIFAGALMASTIMPMKSAWAEEAQPAPAVEQDSSAWAAIRPGYLPRTNQLTARVEGGASSSTGTSLYGFADFQPSEENSASMDSFYSELRLTQELYRGLGIYAELDASSGMASVFRPGLAYTISTDGWFMQLRASPYSWGGAEDVQLAGYISRTFAERISTELLLKGNILSRTIYCESAVDIIFLERFSAGLQVRLFSDLGAETTDVAPVLRSSVTF
jgi:hypothetical protein